MKLITYDCGTEFDIAKFQPVQNTPFVKPAGGLWASPINSQYGWIDLCKENKLYNYTSFEFEFDGRILVIDSVDDAKKLLWRTIVEDYFYAPDFERLTNLYDAIWLTEKGEQETRFSKPSLYGWDCECVLILNPDKIAS